MAENKGRYIYNEEETRERKAKVVNRVVMFMDDEDLSTDEMRDILDVIDNLEKSCEAYTE